MAQYTGTGAKKGYMQDPTKRNYWRDAGYQGKLQSKQAENMTGGVRMAVRGTAKDMVSKYGKAIGKKRSPQEIARDKKAKGLYSWAQSLIK